MNVFLLFLKKVFSQWVIYLGLIPGFYDLVAAYLNVEYKLPGWVTISFAAFVFLYASFRVFKDEYTKRVELETSPTNYEITAILTPIDFESEKIRLINAIEKRGEDVQKLLSSIPETLDENLDNVVAQFLNKSHKEYNTELGIYEFDLEDFIDSFDERKSMIEERLESWKNIQKIDFMIENTGTISDSDINILIECKNENAVFDPMLDREFGIYTYDLIPKIPKKPEKPKETSIYGDPINSFQHKIDELSNSFTHPNAFRKNIEIDNKTCSIRLRDLNVGDKYDIFDSTLYIQINNIVEFKATIKSKGSSRKLEPDVKIVEESEAVPFYRL